MELAGTLTLLPDDYASAHAWVLQPGQEGDNIVQTKHGNKTCAVLHLRIVVAVNHLSVIVLHPILKLGGLVNSMVLHQQHHREKQLHMSPLLPAEVQGTVCEVLMAQQNGFLKENLLESHGARSRK